MAFDFPTTCGNVLTRREYTRFPAQIRQARYVRGRYLKPGASPRAISTQPRRSRGKLKIGRLLRLLRDLGGHAGSSKKYRIRAFRATSEVTRDRKALA